MTSSDSDPISVMLHVLNGDATRATLDRSTVRGTLAVWADALHEGPVPAGLADHELTGLRAAHFASLLGQPEESVLAMTRGWDAGLARYSAYEEVIFWLEHDLFDQLILIRHLNWLSAIDRRGTRFSLICLGGFPGAADFSGLGALTPEQLATLPESRTRITDDQIALGGHVWNLFRSPDPLPLVEYVSSDLPILPFLTGALQRHFEDYPSRENGLSRSEGQILAAVAAGHDTFRKIFAACQQMEERVFMGDVTFWSILERLAGGRNPLLHLNEHPGTLGSPSLRVRLQDLGDIVLKGGADNVELNGIDRWMGGVHLSPTNLWRWDTARRMLTREE